MSDKKSSTPGYIAISNYVSLSESEVDFQAIRAQGAGGQNVNKVSSAIHLRFDIKQSSLPEFYKAELLKLSDQRITSDGIIVIKAQQFRTQGKNREAAISRLQALIKSVAVVVKARRKTKPTRGSQTRRVDGKTKRGALKGLRKKIDY